MRWLSILLLFLTGFQPFVHAYADLLQNPHARKHIALDGKDSLYKRSVTVSIHEEALYDKPVIISEFGGALAGLHSENGEVDERWTEEYQAEVYQYNLEMIANMDFVRGMNPGYSRISVRRAGPYRVFRISGTARAWSRKPASANSPGKCCTTITRT